MFSNFDLRTVGDAEYVAAGQSQLLDRKDAVESLPSKTVTKYMVSIFSARCVVKAEHGSKSNVRNRTDRIIY